MSVSIDFSDPLNGSISISDGAVDTTTPLSLFGNGYLYYGEAANENFLHLLENFSNSISPTNPKEGMIWFDNGTLTPKIYHTATWHQLAYEADSQANFVNVVGDTMTGSLVLNTGSDDLVFAGITGRLVANESLDILFGNSVVGNLVFKYGLAETTALTLNSVGNVVATGDIQANTMNVVTDITIGGNISLTGSYVSNINMGSNKIENLANPDSSDDAINLGYADSRYLKLDGTNDPITGAVEFAVNGLFLGSSGNEQFNINGFDLILGKHDQVTNGNTGSSRAFRKDTGGILAINRYGDFASVRVDSNMSVNGTLSTTTFTPNSLVVTTSTQTASLTVTGTTTANTINATTLHSTANTTVDSSLIVGSASTIGAGTVNAQNGFYHNGNFKPWKQHYSTSFTVPAGSSSVNISSVDLNTHGEMRITISGYHSGGTNTSLYIRLNADATVSYSRLGNIVTSALTDSVTYQASDVYVILGNIDAGEEYMLDLRLVKEHANAKTTGHYMLMTHNGSNITRTTHASFLYNKTANITDVTIADFILSQTVFGASGSLATSITAFLRDA